MYGSIKEPAIKTQRRIPSANIAPIKQAVLMSIEIRYFFMRPGISSLCAYLALEIEIGFSFTGKE